MDRLIAMQVESLPALDALQGYGSGFVKVAMMAMLVLAMGRAAMGVRVEPSAYITPIMHAAAALMLMSAIPSIGAWAAETAMSVEATIGQTHGPGKLNAALSTTVEAFLSFDLFGLGSAIPDLFDLISFANILLFAVMRGARVVMLGVFWPIAMQVTIVLGMISVPLGVIPRFGTTQGWFKMLIEVALWPVIFALISALVVESFENTLVTYSASVAAISEGDINGTFIQQMVMVFALGFAYILLLFMTPVLASAAVRTTPIGAAASSAMQSTMTMAAGAGMLAAGFGAGFVAPLKSLAPGMRSAGLRQMGSALGMPARRGQGQQPVAVTVVSADPGSVQVLPGSPQGGASLDKRSVAAARSR